MSKKPTYEELEQRVEEFENETTELKRVEEALRESEGKFRMLSDQALLGIIILQEELFVYVNDRAAAIMEVTAEEVANWSLGEYAKLIHPDDLAFVMEQGRKKQTGEKGAVIHYNWRMVTPGGNLKWIETWSKTIPFASRTADMVTMIDITERKLAEEALRESEEKFRHLVKNSNDVFVIIDENGKEIFVSDSVERITGLTSAETMEHSGFEFLHPDDVDHISETLSKLIEAPGITIRDEYRHRRKEGGWAYLEAMGTNYLHEPSVGGIVLNIRDITDRKQAEEALRESEEKYRSLVESSDDSIYLVDRNYTYLFMNEQHLSKLGLQPDELLGQTYGDFHSEDDTQAFSAIVEKVFKAGRPIQQEHRSPKDSGYFLRTFSPVKESDGRTRAVTVVSKDITERVRSEKVLLESEGRLARSKKMESLGLLAGGVAHDLNNILSGIVTYPELLLMDLPEDSPLTRPIKTIQESGMRAVDVVADLLTIARGVATGREALNLNTIVTEYLESPECRELERTHSLVDFKTELDSDLLNMSGSPTHIKKALMNLITNASEAIESSGTVTISTNNRYLDELFKGYEDVRQGEYVVLSVSDEGSGISPEDLEKIFEPFYTKKVMGRSGTGLGLAVVWNTVQDHKGYINVKGSEQGTVFELYFPVTREKVAAKEEEVPLEDYLGHGERILVVDDEERQREIAGVLLSKLGYAAEAVSSGEEAIAYLKEHPVDLIVLDMVMPKGINGRETYEEIIKIRPGQKAIIASGFVKTKEVDMAQKLGAGMYIKKPYTLEKIGLAVKEELKK